MDLFLYSYSGPVTTFGKCIMNNFKTQTYAVSEAKAKSNIIYQFKTKYNLSPTARIELAGKIIKED